MELKGLIFLLLLYGGIGVLQARWVAWAQGKTSLQDRCLIPIILSVLLLVLTMIGLRRASGWDTLGWNILVHFGTVPLAAAIGIGTLVGLLRWKHTNKKEKAAEQTGCPDGLTRKPPEH